jgi:putative transposase
MSVTRRVTFRLYPKPDQKKKLFEWKHLHCYLYNACVEHRRTSYQKFGKSVGYFDQQNALPAFKEGKWYASITVDCTPDRFLTDTGGIGLDFGCLSAIADSNGNFVENPRFVKVAQAKINKLAKKSRRKRPPNFKKRVKASRRWKKANKAVSKIQSKVARQRQDWQHKVVVEIVSCNSFIATEKLNLKGITRKSKGKKKRQNSGLNRSLLDVGIGNLKSLIEYKVTEVGGFYFEIPTTKVKPSQTCPKCGYRCDRDVAAAMVMLNYARGMERASSDADGSTSIWCGSLKQVAQKKRQKLAPSDSLG